MDVPSLLCASCCPLPTPSGCPQRSRNSLLQPPRKVRPPARCVPGSGHWTVYAHLSQGPWAWQVLARDGHTQPRKPRGDQRHQEVMEEARPPRETPLPHPSGARTLERARAGAAGWETAPPQRSKRTRRYPPPSTSNPAAPTARPQEKQGEPRQAGRLGRGREGPGGQGRGLSRVSVPCHPGAHPAPHRPRRASRPPAAESSQIPMRSGAL